MEFKCGSVSFDGNFLIKKADAGFFAYAGEGKYISLLNSTHPNDISLLKSKVSALQKHDDKECFCYRMKASDGVYRELVCNLQFEKYDENFSESGIYILNFIIMSDIIDIISKYRNAYYIGREYLSLTGANRMEYNIDSDNLTVYSDDCIEYSENLYTFIKIIHTKYQFDEASEENIEKAACNLKLGVTKFSCRIKGKLIGGNENEINCILKFKTIDLHGHGKTVIGLYSFLQNEGEGLLFNDNPYQILDPMTELLDKKSIIGYAKKLIESKPNVNINLVIFDLDNFKEVNDKFGHLYGDEVIVRAASIVKKAVANVGVAGRIGGDEFMLVLDRITSLMDLRAVLRTIRTNIEWIFKNEPYKINVTCSMGAASYPSQAQKYEDLFKIADNMIYAAKKKGKNRYIIYTPEIHGDAFSTNVETNKENEKNYHKEDVVELIMERALKKGNMSFLNAMDAVGNAFNLDEIDIFTGKMQSPNKFWSKGHSGEYDENINAEFIEKDDFEKQFEKSNLVIIDHTEDIENLYKSCYEYFISKDISAALIYNLSDEREKRYMTFYKKGTSSRKWPESDKTYISFICKAFLLSI